MRDALNNPFSPGSDTVPAVWAGRTQELSDWKDVVRPRRLAGLPERGRTILGEPGLGKSSLVRLIAQNATALGDWVTPQLRIPAGTDPLKPVADAVLTLADQAGLPSAREQRIAKSLRRVQAVAVSGVSLTLNKQPGPEPYEALRDLLVEVGRAGIRQGKVALVHIDEVQNITDQGALSQLLIALGDALTYEELVSLPDGTKVTRSLPLAVYLTGLPDFESRAGASRGATFARRFRTTTLAGLSDLEIRAALQPFVIEGWEVANGDGGTSVISMEQAAAELIVELCKGDPFLFQLAGERAWYAGSGGVITSDEVRAGWRTAESEATAHVERILARLPERELEFLQAMAQLQPEERTLTSIAALLGLTSSATAGPAAQRLDTVRGLIERGKPYRFSHRAVEAYLTSEWPRID
ncbi:MAG: ATP-binding protein [Scrofimicrobium sp.]